MGFQQAQRLARGYGTKARLVVLGGLLLLTMSCVGQLQAGYRAPPGIRGTDVTITLGAPTPLTAADMAAGLVPAAVSTLDAPVPFPDAVDAAQFTPAAVPMPGEMARPFALPSQFDPGPSALPYVFASTNPTDSLRAAICLTSAIYFEAASESDDGQRAVAQVILNRVRHPGWPNTVCGVIYQGSEASGCQFSYACDGSMARMPSREGWVRASRVARAALAGYVHAPVGLATFYHTPQVNPAWNKRLITTALIGNHIFYRLPGANGVLRAFYGRYVGGEPHPGPKPRAFVAPTALQVPIQTAAVVPYPGVPQLPTLVDVPMRKAKVREDDRYVTGALPESDVAAAYQNSGTWIAR